MTQTADKLVVILGHSCSSLPLLLSFLEAADQENLLNACNSLLPSDRSHQLFLNSIHFSRHLRFEHSINLMWGHDQHESFLLKDAAVRTVLQLQELDLSECHQNTVYATQVMQSVLAKIVSVHEADQIVADLVETLREGPLQLPSLRREHIGMHANSNLQLHFCDLLTQEDWPEPEEELYASLRQGIFARQQEFAETARTLKTNLKRMRVLAEDVVLPQQSPCVLVNLISAVLALCEAHISATALYLRSLPDTCQRMVYFVSHYMNFRKSVLALHDKLGFLFSEFQFTFEEIYPEWNVLPSFSIVPILLKKWLAKMGGMHSEFNQMFSLLLLKQREAGLAATISEPRDMLAQTLFNEEFKAKTASLPSFSNALQNALHIKTNQYMKMMNQYPNALTYVVHFYREYLVDLSVNGASVHMNDHSQQQLGLVYNDAAKVILEHSQKFYEHLWASLHSLPEVRFLMDADLHVTNNLIKATTVRELVELANNCLNKMKEEQIVPTDCQKAQILNNLLSDWKDLSVLFAKQDALIESMLENLKITLELPQETKHLFDISRKANLDKLEKLLDVAESECDLSELEGYYSEECEQEQLREVEACHKSVQMEVEDDLLKIAQSIESTKEADSLDVESEYGAGKRLRDYEMEFEEQPQYLKRSKLIPSFEL